MNQTLNNVTLTPAAQRVQAFSHVGSRTLVAAQVSKLREGNAHHHRQDARNVLTTSTSQADMLQISQEQQIRTIDNENALALMPEIVWACRVLVSSILSPKDMTKRELVYAIDLDWLSPSVKSVILEEIKKEMVSVYDYSNSLYDIFSDSLFSKGSHPRLILPEAAVDRIINSGETLTMESLSSVFDTGTGHLKRRGYFGKLNLETHTAAEVINMESFHKASGIKKDESPDEAFFVPVKQEDGTVKYEPDEMITLTDNFDAIKMPFYLEAVASERRKELAERPAADFGDFDFALPDEATLEAFNNPPERSKHSNLTEKEFRNTVYKGAPNNLVTHLRIPGRGEQIRRSVGRPLVLSLPPESVVPICVPGDRRRQLGFLLLIDENGHPITLYSSEQLIGRAQTMFNNMNTANSMGKDASSSMLISKAARNLTGGNSITTFREASKIFEQLVEKNVIPRLMKGAYPGGAELADSGDLFTLMLSRTLCSMRTRLVFVPAEMLTYFAFDYHNNGMGKSLLDSNKILISARAGLLLTRMTSEMRNSIPLTKVMMKIDERDPDWEKTWAETQDAISKTRQPQYPLSTLAVNDIMDWIHRAGFFFGFEGHPRIPDTSFNFEKVNHDIPLPNQEFYDSLGKQLYMGFGIPPELMDSSYDPEFAIAVASRNIMFTQTILEYQKIAAGLITEDHHRLILADGVIMNKIVGMVKSKWGEISLRLPEEQKNLLKTNPKKFALDLVETIVNAIVVSLPSPDATTLENQTEQFRKFEDAVTAAMPYCFSEEVISADIAPELSQKMATMAPSIKAALMRKWMADENFLPQIFEFAAIDEEGKGMFNLLDSTEDWTRGLAPNIMGFAKAITPVEAAVQKDSETLKLGNEGSSGFSGGGGSGGDSSGGSGGGGDDFGLDMDFSIPEMPEENANPDDDSSTEIVDLPS